MHLPTVTGILHRGGPTLLAIASKLLHSLLVGGGDAADGFRDHRRLQVGRGQVLFTPSPPFKFSCGLVQLEWPCPPAQSEEAP